MPTPDTASADLPASMRVGLGQILVQPGDLAGNLGRAAQAAREASAAGCEVLVLPECFDAGWTFPGSPALARPVPGETADFVAALARETGLVIAAGLTEAAGDLVHNTAVLYDAEGTLLARHRKINELPFARRLYTTGTSLSLAGSRFGPLGLDVCADNLEPSLALGRAIGQMGARALLSPSAWAVPPEHDETVEPYGQEWVVPYTALALEWGMPVIGVSNVGPVVGGEWDGWRCIGCSLVVGADGTVLARGDYGVDAEQLLVVDVALRSAAAPA